MLDAYIIDAIRQEELERDRRAEEGRRIWLEIPEPSVWDYDAPNPEAEAPKRGICIIPLHDVYEEEDEAA